MDIEWGLDGTDGKLYILQARPETVQVARRWQQRLRRYKLKSQGRGADRRPRHRPEDRRRRSRPWFLNSIEQMERVQPGDVLVADMTDPDWEPVMKRASAIVTNRGGRTCHAAIIARELGIPAVVGTGNAHHDVLKDGTATVTVSCAEGDTGFVYDGITRLRRRRDRQAGQDAGDPGQDHDERRHAGAGLRLRALPHAGVGLARLEFIINRQIGIHPQALLELEQGSRPDRAPDQRSDDRRLPVAGRLSSSMRMAEGIA